MPRIYRAPYWQPEQFASVSSLDRASEAVRWDHETLWPRYHLDSGVRLLAIPSTVTSLDYALLLPFLHHEAKARKRSASGVKSASRVLDLLGSESLIMPAPNEAAVHVQTNPGALPRCWIAERVERLPPIDEDDMAAVHARTRDVLARLSMLNAVSSDVVIESDKSLPGDERGSANQHLSGNSAPKRCEIIRDDVTQLELEVEISATALVVLADAYDPQWRAYDAINNTPLEIVRTNRVLRGVWLPAGHHRVVFEYRPTAFYLGAWISGIAWLAVVACFLAGVKRPVVRCRSRALLSGP